MSDYTPVDCGLHNKLEATATLKRVAHIAYQTEAGDTTTVESKIVDIYANDGADYCKLEDGTVIRLDRLQSVSAGGEKVL